MAEYELSNITSVEAKKLSSDDDKDSSHQKQKKESSYTRQEKVLLLLTFTGVFFVNACVSLPAPFLPKIDETHGLNSDLTGWLLGISPLIQLVLSPFMGKLIPHIGLHKTIVFGFVLAGVGTALFGVLEFVPTLSQSSPEAGFCALAFTIRAIQSIGETAFATAAFTLLPVTFPDTKTSIMSYSETASGLGIMCGPAIGSAFYAIGGFAGTFIGVGAIMLGLSVVMYFALPHGIGVNEDQAASASICVILSDIKLVLALVMATFSAAIWASVDPILEPELRNKFGLTQELSALCFLLLSSTYALTSPIIGKCLDRFKRLDPFYVSGVGYGLASLNFLIMGPCPLFTWLSRPLWMLLTGLGILGVCLGAVIVPTLSVAFGDESEGEEEVSQIMSTSTTAIISGFYFSAVSFGDFFGPTFSGMVTKESNFAWTMTYYSFGCLAIIFAIILLKIYQAIKRCHKKRLADTSLQTQNDDIVLNEDDDQQLIFTTSKKFRSYFIIP